jgi:hypothetical protein
MGVGVSKTTENIYGMDKNPKSPDLQNEFKKINKIIDDVINSSDMFNNELYNQLLKKKCNQIVLLSSAKMKKYTKSDLVFHDYKITRIHQDELKTDKNKLCNTISNHYSKILQIICLIKYVYDIENNGENNIANIIKKNINVNNRGLVVTYCDVSQKSQLRNIHDDPGVDFSSLAGFDFFVKNILTTSEATTFLDIYEELFEIKNIQTMNNLVCKKILSKPNTNKRIFKHAFNCNQGGSFAGDSSYIREVPSTILPIGSLNPVMSWKLCGKLKTKHIKQTKQITNKINKMKVHYKKNLEQIGKILDRMVIFDKEKGKYEMREIQTHELSEIEVIVKQNIIVFYIKSIIDYKEIFSTMSN